MKKVIMLSLIVAVVQINGAQEESVDFKDIPSHVTTFEIMKQIAGNGNFWSQAENLRKSALAQASKENRQMAIKYLGELLKSLGKTKETVLFEGIKNRNFNPSGFQTLLDLGMSVDAQDADGVTALGRALYLPISVKTVEHLLGMGANPNAADKSGKTPLMQAARNGHRYLTELLLKKNATIDMQDLDGNTALMYAVNRGDWIIVELLLEKGANPNLQDKKGNTALWTATKFNDEGIVNLLKKHGGRV